MGRYPAKLPEKVAMDPADVSDILGRDLSVPGLGAIGHVGIWTGGKVIEVLNQNPTVNQNTLANFKSKSKYWGAVYYPGWNQLPNVTMPLQVVVPYSYSAYTAKFAVIKRATDIQSIGATYTLSPIYKASTSQDCSGRYCTGPTRGTYRCDTFVKDSYGAAGVPGINYSSTNTPSSLWGNYKERR